MCLLASGLGDESAARRCATRALEETDHGAEHGVSWALQLPMLMFLLLSERDDAVLKMTDGIRTVVAKARMHTQIEAFRDIEVPAGPITAFAVVLLAFAIATTAVDNRARATDFAFRCSERLAELEGGSPSPGIWKDLAFLLRAPYEGGHQHGSAYLGRQPPGKRRNDPRSSLFASKPLRRYSAGPGDRDSRSGRAQPRAACA
jgi:hypothetical protein